MQAFITQQQQYTAHQQVQIQALQATIQTLQRSIEISASTLELILTNTSVLTLKRIKIILPDSFKFDGIRSDFKE
jgi:hypothetical protein